MGVIIQAACIWLLYNRYTGGRASPSQNATATELAVPSDALAPSAVSEFSGGYAEDAAAAGGLPFASPPPSLFSMFGLPDPNAAAKARVPEELRARDEARRARLRDLPRDSKLRNLWPPGAHFDLFVFLSTSPAPVSQWEALDAVRADWRRGAQPQLAYLDLHGGVEELVVSGQEAAGGAARWSLMGGAFKVGVGGGLGAG